MDKEDLNYLNERIKQVEEHLNDRIETRNQKLEQVAQEFREQLKHLMKQMSQVMWVTEMCKECQLCQNNVSECKLLREDTNDRR
jgi:hypothetical protein